MKKLMGLGLFLLGSLATMATTYALIAVKTFPDVNYSDYYGNAVNEMVHRGVINGYSNGNFGPNDAVTRAQLVEMLNRYDEQVSFMKELTCWDLRNNEDLKSTTYYEKFLQLCPVIITDPLS